jgi:hypothetical protein
MRGCACKRGLCEERERGTEIQTIDYLFRSNIGRSNLQYSSLLRITSMITFIKFVKVGSHVTRLSSRLTGSILPSIFEGRIF